MARTKPYYTTDELLKTIKRKISFPTSQNTFSTDDLIDFINEEMEISMVPAILEYHEEHFVYKERVPLLDQKNRYAIPNRAIGMRVRDVMWLDQNNNLFEMTKVSPEDKAFFQRNLGANESIHRFYFENNDIVLTPLNISNPTGRLEITYFMRPNLLAENNRAAIATSFTKTIEINNTNLSIGDVLTITKTVTLETGQTTEIQTLIADTDFAIGANSIITATNLTTAINSSIDGITANNGSPSTAINTLDYDEQVYTFTSNSTGYIIQEGQGIRFNSVPSNIDNSTVVDFLQTDAGHKTLEIDIKLNVDAVQGDIVNFNVDEVPETFVVGDYICTQYECIIPQIPNDLHSSLADRVCATILHAIADYDGAKVQNDRVDKNERREGNLLDNRAEGAPSKINARHSLLRYGKSSYRRKI